MLKLFCNKSTNSLPELICNKYTNRLPKLLCNKHTNRLPDLNTNIVTECASYSAISILKIAWAIQQYSKYTHRLL